MTACRAKYTTEIVAANNHGQMFLQIVKAVRSNPNSCPPTCSINRYPDCVGSRTDSICGHPDVCINDARIPGFNTDATFAATTNNHPSIQTSICISNDCARCRWSYVNPICIRTIGPLSIGSHTDVHIGYACTRCCDLNASIHPTLHNHSAMFACSRIPDNSSTSSSNNIDAADS